MRGPGIHRVVVRKTRGLFSRRTPGAHYKAALNAVVADARALDDPEGLIYGTGPQNGLYTHIDVRIADLP